MRGIYVLLTITSILTVSCQPETQIQTLAAMFDSPCEPPCWHNITPGESSVDDVAAVMSDIPGLDSSRAIFKGPWYGYSKVFIGDFLDSGARLEIFFRDDIVTRLAIHQDTGMTLENALALYGKPEDVVLYYIGSGDFQNFVVGMLYPTDGLMVSYDYDDVGCENDYSKIMIIDFCFVDPLTFIDTLTRKPEIVHEEAFQERMYSWEDYLMLSCE